MPTRAELIDEQADLVVLAMRAAREALLKSRPADAAEYADALRNHVISYDVLTDQADD